MEPPRFNLYILAQNDVNNTREQNNVMNREELITMCATLFFYSFVTFIFVIVVVVTVISKNLIVIISISLLSLAVVAFIFKCRFDWLDRHRRRFEMIRILQQQQQINLTMHEMRIQRYRNTNQIDSRPVITYGGVNSQILASLKSLPYNQLQSNITSSSSSTVFYHDKQCAICLLDYEQLDSILILPCHHIFHCQCAHTWFRSKKTCPVCVDDVSASVSVSANTASYMHNQNQNQNAVSVDNSLDFGLSPAVNLASTIVIDTADTGTVILADETTTSNDCENMIHVTTAATTSTTTISSSSSSSLQTSIITVKDSNDNNNNV